MKCKCHGVSGSCSIRTCWRGLQDLREIAMDLKTKYLSATKVVHRPMGTRKQLVPKDIDIRPVRDNELVYLQSSPDFCAKNDKQGSVGTQDRWDYRVITLFDCMRRRLDFGCNNSYLWFGVRFIVMTHNSNRPMPSTKKEMTDPDCLLIQDVDFSEVLSCLVAPFSLQWALREFRLWPVWACVTEKATVTGVLVPLSETMTNASYS